MADGVKAQAPATGGLSDEMQSWRDELAGPEGWPCDHDGAVWAGRCDSVLAAYDAQAATLARVNFRIQLYEFKFEMLGLDKDEIAEQVSKIIDPITPPNDATPAPESAPCSACGGSRLESWESVVSRLPNKQCNCDYDNSEPCRNPMWIRHTGACPVLKAAIQEKRQPCPACSGKSASAQGGEQ